MKLGIVGLGVVGTSLRNWFFKHTAFPVFSYDPPKGLQDNIYDCNVVFMCVPVPTNEDGTQDLIVLKESIELCSPKSLIFVRSTVLPGTCDRLTKEHGKHIFAMPEFLTERRADSDMETLPIVVGGNMIFVANYLFPNKEIISLRTNTEAELAKYTHNCFASVKINFFNMIYEFCKQHDLDYTEVKKAVFATGYISSMHTTVPGPDGERGFGGKCFPKDLKAFSQLLKYESLQAIVRENDEFRKIKEDQKEKRHREESAQQTAHRETA